MNICSYKHFIMRTSQIQEITSLFRILADPTRFRILTALLATKGDLCVGEIADAVGASHSATSHQLAKLEMYNIVSPRREGQTVCYILNDNRVTRTIRNIISSL